MARGSQHLLRIHAQGPTRTDCWGIRILNPYFGTLTSKKKNTMYRAKTLICAVVFEGSKVMLRFFVCIVQDLRETGSSAAYFSESLLSCRVTGIKLTVVNIAHVFLHLIFAKE